LALLAPALDPTIEVGNIGEAALPQRYRPEGRAATGRAGEDGPSLGQEFWAMIRAGCGGVELQHPPWGVHRTGDDPTLALLALAQIDEQDPATGDLIGHLRRGQIRDLLLGGLNERRDRGRLRFLYVGPLSVTTACPIVTLHRCGTSMTGTTAVFVIDRLCRCCMQNRGHQQANQS